MLVDSYVFGPSQTYRVEVTVPAASVASNLTNFPVYVDLSSMPAEFWANTAYRDGRDIRVKDGSGNPIAFDLARFDPIAETGSLFVRRSLSSSVATTFYIHYGDPLLTFLPVTDTYGRNAVWADYHRVFLLGESFADRTGAGAHAEPKVTPETFENTSTSANLAVHQGVCFDGEYYYVTDTNKIKKYDASFSFVAQNLDPCGAVGGGVDHCGDPCVLNGVLYVPMETYVNISTWSNQKIARFRTSDLSLIDVTSVSAQGHEVATLAYCPDDGYIYAASYANGAALRRYNATTLAYVGSLSLSATINQIQGLTYWRRAFWVNSDSTNSTYRVEADGTVRGRVWGITGGHYEGLGHTDDALLLLHDTGSTNGVVRTLKPRATAVGGGVYIDGVSTSYVFADGLSKLTTWTLGVSARLDAKAQNRAIVSYAPNNSSGSTDRTTVAYRSSTDRLGFWNTTDSWLADTVSPTTGVTYRLNVVHDGTTRRRFYRDGANMQSSTPATQKPSGSTPCALFLGVTDTVVGEEFKGEIGFVYLRSGELSADWIAAEAANISAPSSFYDVGAEEAA